MWADTQVRPYKINLPTFKIYHFVIPAKAGIQADEKRICSGQPRGCHRHAPE